MINAVWKALLEYFVMKDIPKDNLKLVLSTLRLFFLFYLSVQLAQLS